MSEPEFDIKVSLDVRMLPKRVPETVMEKNMWERIENRLKRTLLSRKETIEKELSEQASLELIMEEMQPFRIQPCCYKYCCDNTHYNFCPCCGKKIK